jgi:hypothetical protein
VKCRGFWRIMQMTHPRFSRKDSERRDRQRGRIFEMPLDKGVENAVNLLLDADVETFESCEGGEGHAYTEPTIRFHGERAEGFRALSIALQYGLKVSSLRRVWPVNDGEPTGPWWELVFVPTKGR